MNIEAQQYLNKILELTPGELNDMNVAFLRARAEYLTPEQREKFSQFLDPVKSTPMKELRAKAESLGLTPKFGISKSELEQLIANNQ